MIAPSMRAAAVVTAMLATGCPALVGLDQEYAAGEGGSSDAPAGDAAGTDAGGPDGQRGDSAGDAEPDVPPPLTCKSKGTVCVTAPPPTWSGPIEIYDGDPGAAPKSCASPLLEDVSAHATIVSADAVTCTPCGCTLGAISCGASDVRGFGSSSCGNCDGGSVSVTLGTCANASLSCGGFYVQGLIFEPPPATAPCVHTGGDVMNRPPIAWKSRVVGCKAPASSLKQVDCTAGAVCAPVPAPPFQPNLCIYKDGDVSCPGAPYSKRTLAYSSVDDRRGCAPCSCSATPGTCTGKVEAFSDAYCAAALSGKFDFGSCVDVSGSSIYASILSATPPPTLACPTMGGEPSGMATPASPVTICCL